VSLRAELAHVGLRAALAASHFHHLDVGCVGTLEVEDLVRVFARVDNISAERARSMAYCVFDTIAHNEAGELSLMAGNLAQKRQSSRASADDATKYTPTMEFADFADMINGTSSSLGFKRFAALAKKPKNEDDVAELRRIFDEERQRSLAGRSTQSGSPNRAGARCDRQLHSLGVAPQLQLQESVIASVVADACLPDSKPLPVTDVGAEQGGTGSQRV